MASRVHPALLQVQLSLEIAQDLVADLALRAKAEQPLALRVDDRASDFPVLDQLPIFSVARVISLPLDVLYLSGGIYTVDGGSMA